MSDIQEEQKRLYKRAEENDYIIKDIAQYEEKDSKLAKYTILELQKQLDFMIDRNDEKQNIIDKAIEYINVIKDNTPSSNRKDNAKMILINYELLLNKLQGKE